MSADWARELDETQEARPAAINFRDAPYEPHNLRDDEHDIENGARADRGPQRHALGGGGDFALRLLVKGLQEGALRKIDEVTSIDDRARGLVDLRPGASHFWPIAIERDELANEAARRGAIVGCARLGESDMHFRDPRLAPHCDDLARRDANHAGQEHKAEKNADDPERLRSRQQPFDEVGRP